MGKEQKQGNELGKCCTIFCDRRWWLKTRSDKESSELRSASVYILKLVPMRFVVKLVISLRQRSQDDFESI